MRVSGLEIPKRAWPGVSDLRVRGVQDLGFRLYRNDRIDRVIRLIGLGFTGLIWLIGFIGILGFIGL